MEIDLELFRREVLVSSGQPVHLSVIDVSPDHPLHTLVFVHGYGGKALQWLYQLTRFSRSNRVIAMDLRGHGRSDKPAGSYNMAQIQADLLALMDGLQVNGKVILIGHSFGGAVASEFAAAHPERVERLVLIATAAEYRLNPSYRLLLKLPAPVLRWAAPLTRSWLGAPPDVLKSWYVDNLCCWKGWEVFHSLAMPTLVIRGDLDSVFEKPAFEEVARAIPDAEEVDVGASGHMVMLERREAVNRAITRFLNTSKRSWSQGESAEVDDERAGLVKARPWLAHYDEGVPYTLAIPSVPLHHLLDSAVRRFPEQTALIFEGGHLTYRELGREANRFANSLRWLGVEKGDRVILFMPNLPQLVISFYGT
ncbi:MAG TPA: alpha/beta fold hydrolase, partial [Anaerolineales bacterium]